ncbi:phage tail protein, partial [Streptomyces pactum]
TPDRPPPNPGAPSAADAVPAKQPAAVTDFSQGPAANDKALADAEVTEEQLKKGNEPAFDEALTEKKKAEQHSATAPGEARAAENAQLAEAKAGAAASGAQAMASLTATRAAAGKQVDGGKGETKSKDEQKRAQVTARLQKVFDATKKDVETTLTGLDKKVDEQFTAGEKTARDAFTADHEKRMKAYKKKRYSGFFGPAKWAKDKLLGMPAEANQIFQESRKLYVAKVQGVISAVADTIGTELGKAKTRIAEGRADLKAEVDKLPADLKKFGQEAAQDFQAKFEDLETQVNDKSQQLVTDLAQKYTQALSAVDEEIKKLQEANKGLVQKAVDAVAGVIKTIIELKNMLMGVLAKAASAVAKIIKDPIGFLGNLVRAVGAGLNQFLGNIGEHLKKGLVAWLLGTATKAGIEIPPKFDLKGIIALLASMLGLTWANIRTRITRKGVPDQAMDTVEAQVPVASALAKEGPAGAAKEIQQSTGDLKTTILEQLKTYLIPTVIIAGITWILSLLNPASAFIRAVKAIIDIVTFVVTQGAQIIEFVNAILDAVIAIAGGGAAGVPKMVENALATSIPVLLGVLASLLGIGSLAGKVRQVLQTAARPVNRAIDKLVDLIAKKGKQLWAKLKTGDRGTNDRRNKPDNGEENKKSAHQKKEKAHKKVTAQDKEKIAAQAALDGYKSIRGIPLNQIKPTLSQVLAKWRAKGVKRLFLKPNGGSSYHVRAEVNPAYESPAVTWQAPQSADDVVKYLQFKHVRAGNDTWARGCFSITGIRGTSVGPSKNSPYVKMQQESEVASNAHAEEAVTARFKVDWDPLKFQIDHLQSEQVRRDRRPYSRLMVDLDIDVGVSCCLNCADYVAGFVRQLEADGCHVNAKMHFGGLYWGGQNKKPTVVPESLVTRHEELFKLIMGEGFMESGSKRMSPASPGRYWGRACETQSKAIEAKWYRVTRNKDQGKVALAILRNAGISLHVLNEDRVGDSLADEQKIELQKANKWIKKAIEEVNERIKADQ